MSTDDDRLDTLQFDLACAIEDWGLPRALFELRAWCEQFPEHTIELMDRALWIVADAAAPPAADISAEEQERLVAVGMQAFERAMASRRAAS